jgi:hypothetical protein
MAEKRVVIELQLQDQNAVQLLGRLKVESGQVGQAIKQLNADIKAQGFATKEQTAALGELIARQKNLSGQSRELSNDLSGLTAAGMRFRDKMADASRAGLAAFGLNILSVTGAVTAMVSVFKSAVGIAADFDKAQSNLAAVMGTTKAGISDLTAQAKQLGAVTAFTASQVSEGQTELAKLGFTARQITDATPGVLSLASATGTTLANAATIAAQTLNAFQLDAKETGRIVDVIAKSASLSAFDIDTFSAAMSNAAPSANAVGVSVEKAAAMLSTLVDAGIPAEKAGTDLRNVFIELSAKGLTWDQAMQQVRTSTDKLTTATDLFGKRSGSSGIILADSTEKLGRLEEAYLGAAGAAEEMAKTQLDNLKGDQLLLTSAWEGFVLSVDEGSGVISGALRSITQTFTHLLTMMTPDAAAIFGDGVQKELDKIGTSTAKQISLSSDYAKAMINAAKSRVEGLAAIADAERQQANADARRKKLLEDIAKLEAAGTDLTPQGTLQLAVARKELEGINKIIGERTKATVEAAQAADKEAAAIKTIGSKREELTKQLEDYKKRREDLDETDEDGLDTLNRQIKATQDAIKALDGKTTATTKQTAATKGLTEEQQALADQLLRLNELTQNPFKIEIKKEGLGAGPGVRDEEIVEDDPLGIALNVAKIEGVRNFEAEKLAIELEYLTSKEMSEAEYLARMTKLQKEQIDEVKAAQAEADEAKVMAIEQSFNMLTALGQLAKEGSMEAKILAVAQAITGAYLAIINALANPDWVPDPTGMQKIAKAAVIGAAAFSAVARIKAVAGFKEGGYTSRKPSDSAPVGVVHANEYVIPAPIVRDPRYAPILRELEQARLRRGMPYTPNYYQSGGMVPSSLVAQADNTAALQRINFNPVVRVTDINNVQQTVKVIEQRATL